MFEWFNRELWPGMTPRIALRKYLRIMFLLLIINATVLHFFPTKYVIEEWTLAFVLVSATWLYDILQDRPPLS